MKKYYYLITFIFGIITIINFQLYFNDFSRLTKESEIHEEEVDKYIIRKQNGGDTLIDRIYPDFHQCSTPKSSKGFEQKGQFWVIKNYIKALKEFRCNETITLTTHGEYSFLYNLVVLTERWQGPISVAVYAPGTDFEETVKRIMFLRNCVSQQIEDFVTFHIYFEAQHMPSNILDPNELRIKCEDYNLSEPKTSYRNTEGLLYPVNVGRNIARTNVATYFVFASDIELYPSVNVIPEFLKMIERRDYSSSLNKRVFVLPIFEVKKDKKVPETKRELLAMLKTKDANWFHEKICKPCHLPPGSEKWKSSEIKPGLSVMKIGKRINSQVVWEPFYIGTNDEPLFEERLTSEGRANKMTQAYAMCLMGYEYHVLDNAFIVHEPGIKPRNEKVLFSDLVEQTNDLIFGKIVKEYKIFYGDRKGCSVMNKVPKKVFDKIHGNKQKNT